MALEFTIQISDQDLPFFMEALQRAEQRASSQTAAQILDAAGKTFAGSQAQHMPEFVRSRLALVENLIAMARDEGWGLAEEERSRIISVLTYFADPEDLIPDNIPVLGFLDDAIMIDLAERLLQPEIEAYTDFCRFRSEEAMRRGENPEDLKLARVEWMDARRADLHEHMRKRRRSYAPANNWTPQFKFR